jgi:DtxR family Mn-dependent transcriptional regulator
MIDPVLALLIFGLSALVLAALLWPDRGFVSRIIRSFGVTERVRLEDALKHLYKCEYAGRACSVDSVAGSVGVSRTHALELLGKLEELELAQASGEGFNLTDQGREYALHIVRTHRLLERFLADRTGVEPADWHSEAERREHSFSPADTETLSARLGHPLFDPHGDPIPTARGELPPLTGLPLTALNPQDIASIVHLGDEPREVFEALTSVGLSPQMLVRVLEAGPGRVRFEAGGRELALPPVVARNITVEPLPDVDHVQEIHLTLAEVEEGEEVRVLGIHPGLQGPQRRRLLDLGLVPGTLVEAELESSGGDPVAFRVRGALIALRKEQAQWILVDRGSGQGGEA